MIDPSNVDPNTVIGAGLMALASKDMLGRILGPSADYVGGRIEGLVKKCDINLGRIFQYAVRKLGPKINDPGAVNPRVLRHVWAEGAFIEDELAAEYFGGLLASARSPDGKDDRMLGHLGTVRDLSVYDLRLHFLTYSLMRSFFVGSNLWVADSDQRAQMDIYIPLLAYMAAADVQGDWEPEQFAGASLFRLAERHLIGEFTVGSDGLLKYDSQIEVSGMVVFPSYLGAELYLLAYGHRGEVGRQFVDPALAMPSNMTMTISEGSRPLRNRQQEPQES